MASYKLVKVKVSSVFANSNDLSNRKKEIDHLFDLDKRVVHLLDIYWIDFRRDTRLRKETLILVEEQESTASWTKPCQGQ